MLYRVKIQSDGLANEVEIEAKSYDEAASILYRQLEIKNRAGKLMSEKINIFSEDYGIIYTVVNNLT